MPSKKVEPVEDSKEIVIPKKVLAEMDKEVNDELDEAIGKEVKEDVEDLNLLENVFDKRVTDQDVAQEQADINSQASSKALIDKKDIEVKTELNSAEISSMSKLLLIAERHNAPIIGSYLENLMTLKISHKRQGRREFIQGLHADERRDMPQQGFLSKLFGGGGDGSS